MLNYDIISMDETRIQVFKEVLELRVIWTTGWV